MTVSDMPEQTVVGIGSGIALVVFIIGCCYLYGKWWREDTAKRLAKEWRCKHRPNPMKDVRLVLSRTKLSGVLCVSCHGTGTIRYWGDDNIEQYKQCDCLAGKRIVNFDLIPRGVVRRIKEGE